MMDLREIMDITEDEFKDNEKVQAILHYMNQT